MVDCDTRVASSVTLFQRAILNYLAFKAYFQHCETYDDAGVFNKISFTDWRLLVEMEAVTQSLADLALIGVQRSNQVSSELIALLKFTLDRLATDVYQVYDLEAAMSPKSNEHSFPRHTAHVDTFSAEAKTCVNRIKGQVLKRLPTLLAESAVILLLDPRAKFTVESLVKPAALEEGATSNSASDDTTTTAIDNVVREGKYILRNAHREVFCAMHAADSNNTLNNEMDTPPNLDLVTSAGNDLVMYGAPLIDTTTATTPLACLHDQADEELKKWQQHAVNWVRVAVQQASGDKLTTEDFTRLLLVRRNNAVCWNLTALCKHVDVCRWYRDTGAAMFPSIAALARVWLGRSPSNAFQERVFSTGAFVMSSLRTSTDNRRAEMQVLMKHNRSEIQKMEMANLAGGHSVDYGELV